MEKEYKALALHVGNEIKVARSVRGVTQKQLATAIGTKQSVVSAWESGKQLPTIASMTRISVALNVVLTIGIVARRNNDADNGTTSNAAEGHQTSETVVCERGQIQSQDDQA